MLNLTTGCPGVVYGHGLFACATAFLMSQMKLSRRRIAVQCRPRAVPLPCVGKNKPSMSRSFRVCVWKRPVSCASLPVWLHAADQTRSRALRGWVLKVWEKPATLLKIAAAVMFPCCIAWAVEVCALSTGSLGYTCRQFKLQHSFKQSS